jgi:hypothetical protein
MRIRTLGPGPHHDISIAAGVVTVGEVTLDVAERQADTATVIDLRCSGGQVREGGDGHQVASLHIPPRRLQEVETGETDDEGNPEHALEPVPLDPAEVTVTLWTYTG